MGPGWLHVRDRREAMKDKGRYAFQCWKVTIIPFHHLNSEQGCAEFKSYDKLKLNSCSFNSVTRRTPSELGSASYFSPSSHAILAVASSAYFQHTGLSPGPHSHPSPLVQPQSSASIISTTWECSKSETCPVSPSGSVSQNLHFNKVPGDSRAR